MKLVPIVVLLVTLGLPNLAMGCSCMWGGAFAKVALGKELIVLGEVRSHYKNSMEVKVLEVLKGHEERKTIRIWGDTGALCRPYVSAFPIGTTWLLAVFPLLAGTIDEQPSSSQEGFTSPPSGREYAISVCGDFWLKVEGERAVGRITLDRHSQSLEWVPLKDMLTWLQSGGKAVRLSPAPLE